ncbi:MAG: hypothetical protein FJ276_29600 [Planctomycetes bacterium]|nr:hypothetical protein [Planctomycetota bacterium]
MNALCVDIESIRARCGYLPEDGKHLTTLREEPLPVVEEHVIVNYSRLNQDEFYVSCLHGSFWGHMRDPFGYIVLHYGPRSPQRIDVVRF